MSTKHVKEFHEAMGLPAPSRVDWPELTDQTAVDMLYAVNILARLAVWLKGTADGDPYLLRFQLMVEELSEFGGAIVDEEPTHRKLHELTDLQYVVDGTYVQFGLDTLKQKATEEVHRANMSKFDDDGNPVIGPSGRVEKGPNYKKADLSEIV